MKVKVYTIDGKSEDTVDLAVPKISMSPEEFSQAIRVYVTNLHQGTKSTKTRGDVVHSDRKPWRQKGTGRARAGSKNSPIWVGGGVAHGPKPYTRRLRLNKKQKARLFAYMIAKYLDENRIIVLDASEDDITTKKAFEFLKKIKWHPFKIQFVTVLKDNKVVKAFRNLEKVKVRRAQLISPFDLYRNSYLIVTKQALESLNKRLNVK